MPRPRKIAGALVLWLGVAVMTSCDGGDGDGPMEPGLDPDVFQLSAVSGGGQTGLVNTVLPTPLAVRVSRIEGGVPEEGVSVEWTVISGSAEPTRERSATDEDGQASTRIVLGSSHGQVVVRARVAGLDPVELPALTALLLPSISSLSTNNANPGDIIEVRVDNLPAGLPADVLFDGVVAEPVERIEGSPAVLRVTVPAPVGACEAAVQSVDVRLRVDGVTIPGRTLNVSVPAEPFQVGQVLVIETAADVDQCAQLPPDDGTAKYLLVALTAAFESTGKFQISLGGNTVTFASAAQVRRPEETSFHSRLRELERRLIARGLEPAAPPSGPRLLADPQVGDVREFWVINQTEFIEITDDLFDRITATLEFVGVHTLLYVDDRTPQPGLTDADIQNLGEIYDRFLYDADVDYFGPPSDFDGNDRVIVLLTPTVNALTPPGAGGVVVGFTFALDLFDPTTPNCFECGFSNGGEVFYGLVPDPSGEFSDARSEEFVLDVLPGVLVHETQHMISFNFKLFVNNLLNIETLWLSEALAHMAEEVGGDAALDRSQELADDLYQSNFTRALRYLLRPDSVSVTTVEGTGSAAERGGGWMFLRWLADQYGDFIFRDLTQAPENGVDNIEEQTGEDFFRLFADFAVATWADDLAIPGLNVRHQIPKWDLRSILRVNPQGGGDPVYALQPIEMTFQQLGGPTQIQRLMGGSSALYVQVDAGGATQPLQLQLSGPVQTGLAILRYE